MNMQMLIQLLFILPAIIQQLRRSSIFNLLKIQRMSMIVELLNPCKTLFPVWWMQRTMNVAGARNQRAKQTAGSIRSCMQGCCSWRKTGTRPWELAATMLSALLWTHDLYINLIVSLAQRRSMNILIAFHQQYVNTYWSALQRLQYGSKNCLLKMWSVGILKYSRTKPW